MLILPSTLVRAETYRPTVRALAPRHHVVVPELPGSGTSTGVQRPWSFAAYAEWTRELVDELGLVAPVVVGHSNSGAIALELAARFPEVVGALVLVGSIGAHPTGSLGAVMLGRTLDGVLELGLTLRACKDVAWNVLVHPDNFFPQVWACAKSDLRATAREVRCPVLLAWGGRDHTMPLAAAQAFARALPDASLCLHPRGSHDWLIQHAHDFAGALDDFLRHEAACPSSTSCSPASPDPAGSTGSGSRPPAEPPSWPWSP